MTQSESPLPPSLAKYEDKCITLAQALFDAYSMPDDQASREAFEGAWNEYGDDPEGVRIGATTLLVRHIFHTTGFVYLPTLSGGA